MYKYEILIFVWERDFSDVIKYVHNKKVISPIQLSEVDSVKELCKMRDGVLFSNLSKSNQIKIFISINNDDNNRYSTYKGNIVMCIIIHLHTFKYIYTHTYY